MNTKQLYGKYFSKEHDFSSIEHQVLQSLSKKMGFKITVILIYLCFHKSFSAQLDHVWEVTLKSDIPYNEKIMLLVKEFNLNHPYIYKPGDD